MTPTFQQNFQSDPFSAVVGIAIAVVLIMVQLAFSCGILYGFYLLLTLPLRRNERARLFLDLLELGLKDGRSPEAAILDVLSSGDRSLGERIHLLTAHLQNEMRLSAALDRVPRLLPPQVHAMLRAGERIGDVAKVLPACRQLLQDGVSQVRGALNYIVVLAFCATPGMLFVPLIFRVKVLPAFRVVFEGMNAGGQLPALTRLIFDQGGVLSFVQFVFLSLVWLLALAYVGGPRLRGWLQHLLPGITDGILCRLPWRRKRLQRDFSAMLAVLLDAQVPEPKAVALAAESTANTTIIHRAAKVRALLEDGTRLPDALRVMDDSGELHWRLSNALQRRGGFLRALTGWHEALDAKAFQLEQAAAQITTTALVLLNGVIVAAIVIAMFLPLIDLLNQATLW